MWYMTSTGTSTHKPAAAGCATCCNERRAVSEHFCQHKTVQLAAKEAHRRFMRCMQVLGSARRYTNPSGTSIVSPSTSLSNLRQQE